jgi:hypothetical protein
MPEPIYTYICTHKGIKKAVEMSSLQDALDEAARFWTNRHLHGYPETILSNGDPCWINPNHGEIHTHLRLFATDRGLKWNGP